MLKLSSSFPICYRHGLRAQLGFQYLMLVTNSMLALFPERLWVSLWVSCYLVSLNYDLVLHYYCALCFWFWNNFCGSLMNSWKNISILYVMGVSSILLVTQMASDLKPVIALQFFVVILPDVTFYFWFCVGGWWSGVPTLSYNRYVIAIQIILFL